jgi:hypothetical protein
MIASDKFDAIFVVLATATGILPVGNDPVMANDLVVHSNHHFQCCHPDWGFSFLRWPIHPSQLIDSVYYKMGDVG